MRRVELLRSNMRSRAITYNWHAPDVGEIEAVLARGDRRVGDAIEKVWQMGGKLDSWSDYFSLDRWKRAFDECGIDIEFYARRVRDEHEIFPWDVISVGVDKEFLASEREAAKRGTITPDCRVGCAGCGASGLLDSGRQCDE